MPGIVGLITKEPRAWAEQMLARMTAPLLHEPFYTSGSYCDESLGVYVSWVARQNAFDAAMPLRNASGSVALIFSGEDYPEPGTARRMRQRGLACAEEGPSYLLPLYEEDPDFFRNLNGRFQGLVADRTRGTAVLFNDRFGGQRLYVHEAANAFYFSAEAKSILTVRPELRRIHPRSFGEYVACSCVLENRTLFDGITVLPPGSAWRFRNGALESKSLYFEPCEWEQQERLPAEEFYRELRDVFTSRLPRYFEGAERPGVSLTGGLDTRIIMAWHKAAAGSLPCYTFGSMYRENQDVSLARRVAQICGQPYQVIPVDDAYLSRIAHYADRTLYLTDGCVDMSRTGDLYCNEIARQIAPLRVVGTFGSEIIRGAIMFKPMMPEEGIYRPEAMAQITGARQTYQGLIRGHATSTVAFRQTSTYHYGIQKLEQSQLTLRSPYLDNELVRTVYRAPQHDDGEDVRLRLMRDGNPELARLRSDRGLGPANPLVSALRRAYLEFTFKAEYAYDYGMPHWVAGVDSSLAPLHLERLWMGRHKLFHFRWWYRTVLAPYVQEILLDPRTLSRPYLNRAGVEQVVKGHLSGKRNYTTEIHRLLSVELIHRLFVDA